MPPLRIATYNVNGIRSRLPHLLQWLQREQPDIACLQELKAQDADFPVREIEATGYGAIWQGQRSWNGVAVLARGDAPVETRRGLPGEPEDTQSRYLEAVAHGVIVGCLYLPNGNPQPGPKFEYKLRWFERLIAHAQTLLDTGHPVVLAGDYNVVPTDELDIYNPRSWRRDALLQPESRECWRRLLAQGWTDALRTHFGDEKVFTFWDYFRQHWERDAGLRIDHLLLSPSLAPRLIDAGVDRWVRALDHASDHAPTWVRLEAAPAAGSEPSAATRDRRGDEPGKPARRRPASKTAPPAPRKAAARKKATAKTTPNKAARKPIGTPAKPKATQPEAGERASPAKRSPRPASR